MKRFLIVGRGFVGAEFASNIKYLGAEFRQIGSASDVEREIIDYKPNYLINAAGYCGGLNIDDCEINRQHTFESNLILPATIADICRRRFIPWIHVSTACCWNGNRAKNNAPVPWTEEDRPTIDLDDQIYAGSKLLAEKLIAHSFCMICRIRMPFTPIPHHRNLITKLIKYPMAMEGDNSLTYLPEAIDAMLNLLGRSEYGIYHVTNLGYLSTHEMIDIIEKYIKPKRDWPIVPQERLLNPSIIALRSTCIISSAKIAKVTGHKMEPVKEAFIKACKLYARNK
jgi:dTDP-4-dehydrorhamnose reductase